MWTAVDKTCFRCQLYYYFIMQESKGSKSPFGMTSAFLGGCAFGFLAWCACLTGVARISDATHSGLLGICGPYGDHVGLVVLSFLASFPLSAFAGVWFGKALLRHFRGSDTAKSGQESKH